MTPGTTTETPPAAAIVDGVLLADDDTIMCGIVRGVLERAGQRVFVAADGIEAIALAHHHAVRLVLLDIGMPNLGGLRACEELRALPGYERVPIVMLTGYGDERMRQSAMELGANDFITKPFRPDELLARLSVYLNPPAKPTANRI